MSGAMTRVNNTLLYICKLLRDYILKILTTRKKNVTMQVKKQNPKV